MERDKSCKERWKSKKDSTIKTLKELWKDYCEGKNEEDFYEYGLSFDYVAPETFKDENEGYWRYQISWGGPSDEFRFYSSSPNSPCYKITYAFLDWFDGHEGVLKKDDLSLMKEIWEYFQSCETTNYTFDEAMKE